jgi:hypothetical protein
MIYKKLLEFQKLNITIKKDATNPHFKSRYSSLNEVLDKVKGPLNELGVVIVQEVQDDGLRTYLVEFGKHPPRTVSDNEPMQPFASNYVECFVPFIGATDMQKLGGAITYARRYSLVTLLGLEDEDDDGNAASEVKRPATARTEPSKGVVGAEGEPFPSGAGKGDFSI